MTARRKARGPFLPNDTKADLAELETLGPAGFAASRLHRQEAERGERQGLLLKELEATVRDLAARVARLETAPARQQPPPA